jgi:hypothetical protein
MTTIGPAVVLDGKLSASRARTSADVKRILTGILNKATVTVHEEYFYRVDFGPDVRPQQHIVSHDLYCSCRLERDCIAVTAVKHYLQKEGGPPAQTPRPGYFPVAPQRCPMCGARARYDPRLSSRQRGAGWSCAKGRQSHYWEAQLQALRENLAKNPWILPPVVAPDGRVLAPGLKREDLITESLPWPDGYNPDQ